MRGMKHSQTPCALKKYMKYGLLRKQRHRKKKVKNCNNKEQKKKVLKKHLCNSCPCKVRKGLRIKKNSIITNVDKMGNQA